MKCSICGTDAVPGLDCCPDCGCRYSAQPTGPRSPFDPNYIPPAKKKNWLWVFIPVTVVCLLIVAGFTVCVTSMLRNVTASEPPQPAESVPATPKPDATVPYTPASEDCFMVVEGVLKFLPERYDGGPVLQIPETVGGETVTAIGPECFAGCGSITTIVLPDTVTGIQAKAFAGCTELRGLFVPEGTQYIGKDAFEGCIKLEAIYIPATVTSIHSGAFDDCASLTYIFYGGIHKDWANLYSDYIMPYTFAICLDGEYYHGVE